MSRLLLAALLFVVGSTEASSADPPSAGAATEIRETALRAHTGFLADDLLEGRDTGTRGFDLAAAYIAAQFEIAGLEPGGSNGAWTQPFTVRRRTLERADISYVVGGRPLRLVNGEDVALDASPRAINETLELELVFVGWGIEAPHLGFDDYRGLDVRGKAVVLLEGAPASLPPALRAHYSWIQQKERMAVAHGATAVLTVKSPAREAVAPWDRARRGRPLPAVGRVGAGVEPGPHATMTLGPTFARIIFREAGRDLDRFFRQSETSAIRGFDLPGSIRIARTSRHEDAATANVIGWLRGADPKLRDEFVVVLAHLDHVGIGPAVAGDAIYNGAIDNAGGVAVMLEAARALRAGPPPKRSVLFIATAGEERGLLGSEAFVADPTTPLSTIRAAISVDGLMTFHDFGGIVALGAEHSSLGEISATAAAAIGARHVPDPIPERGNLALSDQYPFLRHGTPVLFPNPARGLARSGPDGLEAWDTYEARSYHQPSDDLSLPIRWDMAARWGEYIRALVAGAANAEPAPAWYAGDPLADAFAPTAPRRARPRSGPGDGQVRPRT